MSISNILGFALTATLAIIARLLLVRDRKDSLQAEQIETLRRELAEVRNELETVKTKISPFWESLQRKLADTLTRPTHTEMDELLRKLKAETITDPERGRLDVMLHETMDDPEIKEKFKQFVRTMITTMPLALEEKRDALLAAKGVSGGMEEPSQRLEE